MNEGPGSTPSEDSSAPSDSPGEHPYRRAWRSRDTRAWGRSLAPDVVMLSPVFSKPLAGREIAVDLFDSLFTAIGAFQITDELVDGRDHVFFWEAECRDKTITGADLVRMDDDGLVAEITVLIRPLVGIAIFGAALGPALAAKRGRGRSLLVRLLNAPLKFVFALVDRVGSRLLLAE